MSTGAKTAGAAATIVHGTVRDIAEVKKLDYPLFARGVSPVGVSGRMEPTKSQVELNINGVRVRPGDVIFADISGVVVIPEELVAVIADDADANGDGEIQCRERILSGENCKASGLWDQPVRSDRQLNCLLRTEHRFQRRRPHAGYHSCR